MDILHVPVDAAHRVHLSDTAPQQLCALGGWIIFVVQAQHGLGKHQETISPSDLVSINRASFAQSILSGICAMAFLKISIGFNLLRLDATRWYRWSLWATIGMPPY